ncbi:MAG: trehalose-phosphatase [Actinomycetota bacterium]
MPAEPSERAAGLPGWFPGEARPVGVFLDYDGTLSEIAPTPEEARPAPGLRDALEGLVAAGAETVVISGRRAGAVAAMLEAPVRCFGLYGLEDERGPVSRSAELVAALESVLPDVERAAALVPGSRVEAKGLQVAVHYRASPEPETARRVLVERLRPVAEAHGYRLLEGKKVVELAAVGGPTKGDVVARVVKSSGLRAAMYAGDDAADEAAFEAIDRLTEDGLTTLKVAVRHPEAPAGLIEAADVVVEGPDRVVALLRELTGRLREEGPDASG